MAPSVFSTDLLSSSALNHRSRHNVVTSSKTLQEVQEYGAPEKGLKIMNTSSILPGETSDLVVSQLSLVAFISYFEYLFST